MARVRGTLLGVCAMFAWGAGNHAARVAVGSAGWPWDYFAGLAALAGLGLANGWLSPRSGRRGDGDGTAGREGEATAVGRLTVGLLLSLALSAVAAVVGTLVEALLFSRGWESAAALGAWHALGVFAVGVSVTSGERSPRLKA